MVDFPKAPFLTEAMLLENVMGINLVMDAVCKHLEEMLPEYELFHTVMDPRLDFTTVC